ncbi:hypothetical protein [Candidatus Neoehrlichia procyonis]|uniref:Uncharacterized protein n=1 Tax=Candidatus Neoehrlichia procyonis str. RAC413 TaxID=1359163 RepID=A0A0F3NMX1_9RICK|nr:hypothetical protein [Candidatus Neoehrlichia lotoris]KJV69418.1 hypothetical protein NLO413_0810 [Candidatus Neoehrlichia lotoris str. RAC413]
MLYFKNIYNGLSLIKDLLTFVPSSFISFIKFIKKTTGSILLVEKKYKSNLLMVQNFTKRSSFLYVGLADLNSNIITAQLNAINVLQADFIKKYLKIITIIMQNSSWSFMYSKIRRDAASSKLKDLLSCLTVTYNNFINSIIASFSGSRFRLNTCVYNLFTIRSFS